MNTQRVLSSEIQEVNSGLRNIHIGGCLLFAHKLQQLLSTHNIKSSIHMVAVDPFIGRQFIDDMIETVSAENISDALFKISKKDIQHNEMMQQVYQFPHCAVRVDGILYDNNGVIDSRRVISHHLEPYAVNALLARKDIWNHLFKDSNPHVGNLDLAIERALIKVLKKLDT